MVKRTKVPDVQKQNRAELAHVTRENTKRQREMDRLESEAGKLITRANEATGQHHRSKQGVNETGDIRTGAVANRVAVRCRQCQRLRRSFQ
jgi:peptidoglycan hydrolase CwlO-like protein